MSKEDFLRSQLDRAVKLAEGRRVDLEGQLDIMNTLERLLLNLTSGGSEFNGNPRHCAQWAKARLTAADALAKRLKEAKSAIELMDEETLGRDPEIGYAYRDELLHHIKVALREYREAK